MNKIRLLIIAALAVWASPNPVSSAVVEPPVPFEGNPAAEARFLAVEVQLELTGFVTRLLDPTKGEEALLADLDSLESIRADPYYLSASRIASGLVLKAVARKPGRWSEEFKAALPPAIGAKLADKAALLQNAARTRPGLARRLEELDRGHWDPPMRPDSPIQPASGVLDKYQGIARSLGGEDAGSPVTVWRGRLLKGPFGDAASTTLGMAARELPPERMKALTAEFLAATLGSPDEPLRKHGVQTILELARAAGFGGRPFEKEAFRGLADHLAALGPIGDLATLSAVARVLVSRPGLAPLAPRLGEYLAQGVSVLRGDARRRRGELLVVLDALLISTARNPDSVPDRLLPSLLSDLEALSTGKRPSKLFYRASSLSERLRSRAPDQAAGARTLPEWSSDLLDQVRRSARSEAIDILLARASRRLSPPEMERLTDVFAAATLRSLEEDRRDYGYRTIMGLSEMPGFGKRAYERDLLRALAGFLAGRGASEEPDALEGMSRLISGRPDLARDVPEAMQYLVRNVGELRAQLWFFEAAPLAWRLWHGERSDTINAELTSLLKALNVVAILVPEAFLSADQAALAGYLKAVLSSRKARQEVRKLAAGLRDELRLDPGAAAILSPPEGRDSITLDEWNAIFKGSRLETIYSLLIASLAALGIGYYGHPAAAAALILALGAGLIVAQRRGDKRLRGALKKYLLESSPEHAEAVRVLEEELRPDYLQRRIEALPQPEETAVEEAAEEEASEPQAPKRLRSP